MGPPLPEGLDSALGAEREVARRDKEGDREAGETVRSYEYKSMIDSPQSAEGMCISFIAPVRLCNFAPVFWLFYNSPCKRLKI
jgi:hypothetical protein